MQRRHKWVAIVAIGAATALGASPAAASHPHYLVTPGSCVEDIADGQTSQSAIDGGYHQFHDNVHKGAPGTVAFGNEHNPVSVDKGTCTCP